MTQTTECSVDAWKPPKVYPQVHQHVRVYTHTARTVADVFQLVFESPQCTSFIRNAERPPKTCSRYSESRRGQRIVAKSEDRKPASGRPVWRSGRPVWRVSSLKRLQIKVPKSKPCKTTLWRQNVSWVHHAPRCRVTADLLHSLLLTLSQRQIRSLLYFEDTDCVSCDRLSGKVAVGQRAFG